jgi:4-alpha-glucanotransferase
LWISDNNGPAGSSLIKEAIPMAYLNEEFWEASIKIEMDKSSKIQYKYLLKNKDGEIVPEWGDDRLIEINKENIKEILVIDTWNHTGEYENVFY